MKLLSEADLERRHFNPAQRDAFFRIDGSTPKDDLEYRRETFFMPDPTTRGIAPDPRDPFTYRLSDDLVFFVGQDESEAAGYYEARAELLSQQGHPHIHHHRNYWGSVRPRGR